MILSLPKIIGALHASASVVHARRTPCRAWCRVFLGHAHTLAWHGIHATALSQSATTRHMLPGYLLMKMHAQGIIMFPSSPLKGCPLALGGKEELWAALDVAYYGTHVCIAREGLCVERARCRAIHTCVCRV